MLLITDGLERLADHFEVIIAKYVKWDESWEQCTENKNFTLVYFLKCTELWKVCGTTEGFGSKEVFKT